MGLFHTHQWKLTHIEHYEWERAPATTLILWKCSTCFKPRTEQRQGKWTTEEVGPVPYPGLAGGAHP